jgi:hypothetical protein
MEYAICPLPKKQESALAISREINLAGKRAFWWFGVV